MNLTTISCPVITIIEEGSTVDLMTSGDGDIISIEDDEESTAVCGADGQTYASVCHLLQTSPYVRILHAGACDVGECQARKVSS